ncbi:uncharacterized protein BDZ99DRAFT_395113 [Mytilinidion resinicola]|uniref:Zn(2)-C6 fungal-type domain-containing protein n=1 Tax=Mytilinidion resinicola TaxID=574789 RepID=A0A6A6YBX9_9PEZI|nr:uncharacterized protein BDZ99DRAFT_395113 [Mytilinidion resinicola]KAF2806013.1 hypothetical protein BDZ99DRAFT_395113 [Mytilinidion resinicola]
MQSGGRKRVVSSCIPCYRKKQKCNRRYPCNHCTRRRQPEECTYHPSQASQAPQTETRPHEDVPMDHDAQSQDVSGNDEPVGASSDWSTRRNSTLGQGSDSLAELFGYVEHSESNTMALVRRLGLGEDEHQNKNRDIPLEAYDEIEKSIRRLPGREIFDFLVQYYVTEVHWMEQVVYAPWFLGQYQKWWTLGRLSGVLDVEFAVLFLRICSYASQFLPSPSYTIDRIRGMPLADIRDTCHDIAEKLAAICVRLDARGTLLRVQHLSVLGLQWQCEGRINAFWEALSNAVRVAQRIGLHRGRAAWMHGMHEFDKEIRCRVFCNLYIWDSLLSRQLDCNPFLSATLTSDHLPRMHLAPNVDDADAPEGYSDRLMQARLANFWRSFPPRQGAEYEATVAEERYEKFCGDFLTHLPPVFALEPSEEWDERLPKLPLQRQILHVAIFDSLCYNFRPVLLREPGQVQSLPAYKQVLVASQRRALAAAALKMLDGVSKLHAMLGRSHTRFAAIILPTFEAAVVLVSLTMDGQFPGTNLGEDGPLRTLDVDPLGWEKAHLTRDRCRRAAQEALARLEMLAEVSNMAEAAAATLARLMARMPSSDVAQWPSPSALDDFFAHCSADTFPGLDGELPD